jgi:DDE superfamily endonuclease
MPLPIICASAALCQFALTFSAVFTKPQRKYFVTVLLALVQSEDRRTLTGHLRKVLAQFSLVGLSRFLARAPWSETWLGQRWLAHLHLQLESVVRTEHQRQRAERAKRPGRPRATSVTGYLIYDDSTHSKPKGRNMKGLGRHYSTTERKQVTGHSLFIGLHVLLGRRCPLPPQMYRTQTTCAKESVPFKSKVDLADQGIQDFVPVLGEQVHVLVDAWYTCQRLWKAARARGFDFSGGLKSNRKLRRVMPNGKRVWQHLSDYATELSAGQFQAVVWPAQDGGRTIWVHCVRTLVHRLGACQVVIVREKLDASVEQTRYFATSLLDANAQTVVNVLAVRWDIETLFEDLKELFGTDHYQLMNDRAIVRYWTLASCACLFLDERRTVMFHAQARHITIGEARQNVQKDHQLNLLQWLQNEFQNGCMPTQLQACFAA